MSEVAAFVTTPVPSLVAVTVVPVIMAPLGSVTKPEILPVLICAGETTENNVNTITSDGPKRRIDTLLSVVPEKAPVISLLELLLTCEAASNRTTSLPYR